MQKKEKKGANEEMSKSKGKWIQDAIKRPGALREKAKKMGLIKGKETMSAEDLGILEKSSNPLTRKQAALAKTLRKFKKK